MNLTTPLSLHASSRRVTRCLATLGAVGLIALTACGSNESTSNTTSNTTAAATAEITFSGQWARTSPMMASIGAAYVTITSPADDALIGATVDPSIAPTVEVHETVMGTATTVAMSSDSTTPEGSGEMMMREVAAIELPAGVAVELQPGGYHIMLIDLVEPLATGTTFALTLEFETAGEITIDVPVLDEAP